MEGISRVQEYGRRCVTVLGTIFDAMQSIDNVSCAMQSHARVTRIYPELMTQQLVIEALNCDDVMMPWS